MILLEYIDTFYFVLAFGIGIFLSYIFAPEPRIIVQYPTPDNAGKITYQDDAGVCYKYRAVSTSTQCPSDKSKVKDLKLQN
jgi:hypothetical protein